MNHCSLYILTLAASAASTGRPAAAFEKKQRNEALPIMLLCLLLCLFALVFVACCVGFCGCFVVLLVCVCVLLRVCLVSKGFCACCCWYVCVYLLFVSGVVCSLCCGCSFSCCVSFVCVSGSLLCCCLFLLSHCMLQLLPREALRIWPLIARAWQSVCQHRQTLQALHLA